FDIMDELRSYAEGAEPRLEIELFQVLPDRLNSDLAGEVAPVVITLFGNNLPVMQESASQIAAALEKIPNVVDVYQGYETSEPELNIRIIPEIAARLGVSVAEVRRAVNMALWGETTTHVVEGLKVIPVQLRYPARDYRHLEEIRRLPVYLPELDRMITLEEVADIRKSPGLTDVENENLSLVVNVSAQLSGRDLGSVMKDVRATLQRMSLPPGITLRIGGASESQRQAFYQLLLILGFGTLMVFAILLFEFKSFKTAAIVMTGTLLSISGVFLLLWITGIPLDISAFMGMIMIIGVVVNNGILVIDYTEYYRRTSPDTAEALLAAVKVRLRPVLMTTLSTIIGFLPLALALGEGGEMLQPLAVSMIGGMSFSLLLSLVVIPVLYYTAHRGKEIINTP
ncbi:MAG: efflux RND transporter permease subunit, partial [Calditrichaeota bacterium]|nr:efflux RND transporter permease subunit [Calditrichota bacterium]